MKNMIFWGASGQAKVLRECMKNSGLNLVAIFDNDCNTISPFTDVPLYYGKKGFENWIYCISKKKDYISNGDIGFLVAIGGDNKGRIDIQEYLESHGLVPLIARHPTTFIADDVKIGKGSQILAQSSICVESIINRGCIINTGVTIDHECYIGNGVHICPGVHLAGLVKVEDYVTIYTGAIILPRVTIGKGAIIGAGSVVRKDVKPYTIVVGNPARFLRVIKEEIHEKVEEKEEI